MPLSKFQKTQDQHIHSLFFVFVTRFLAGSCPNHPHWLGQTFRRTLSWFWAATHCISKCWPGRTSIFSHVNETQCDILGIYTFFLPHLQNLQPYSVQAHVAYLRSSGQKASPEGMAVWGTTSRLMGIIVIRASDEGLLQHLWHPFLVKSFNPWTHEKIHNIFFPLFIGDKQPFYRWQWWFFRIPHPKFIVMGGLRESPTPRSWKFDEDWPGNHRVYCGSDDEAP